MSITVLNGYSRRYNSQIKTPSHSKDSVFLTPKVNKTQETPKAKIKLTPLSPISTQATKFNKIINSNSRISAPRYCLSNEIELNSKEYESEISKHLGVNPQSRESYEEDQSPLIKIISQAPQKFKVKELNLPDNLKTEAIINQNEKILNKRLSPVYIQGSISNTKNTGKAGVGTSGIRSFLNKIRKY